MAAANCSQPIVEGDSIHPTQCTVLSFHVRWAMYIKLIPHLQYVRLTLTLSGHSYLVTRGAPITSVEQIMFCFHCNLWNKSMMRFSSLQRGGDHFSCKLTSSWKKNMSAKTVSCGSVLSLSSLRPRWFLCVTRWKLDPNMELSGGESRGLHS